MEDLNIPDFNIKFGNTEHPVIMAGVNVLEDHLDIPMEVGTELKSICEELKLPYVFKASFDKANRSSIKSFRGPGIKKGLDQLSTIKKQLNVPIVTDIHEPHQAESVAEIADIMQIPAFLCRQTDLLSAACQASEKHNRLLHIKKGQFLAPWDCKNIVDKVGELTKSKRLILCERGTSFGYNNLIVDILGIQEMKNLGVPVTIDATHAVQLPGQGMGAGGQSTATGGRRSGVPTLSFSGIVAGADGLFLEFHPEPDKALCDGPSALPLTQAKSFLQQIQSLSLWRQKFLPIK